MRIQPLRPHHIAVDLDVERRLRHAAAGERRLVDKDDVCEVEDVVDQKLVVAFDVKHPVHAGPAGLHVLAEVGDERGIGQRGLHRARRR